MARVKLLQRPAHWLVYAGMVLLIFLPWLKPGFLLTLDLTFTPHIPMPASVGSSYLLHVFLHAMNLLLPGDVVEKLLLMGIFILCGSGMHRLVQYMDAEHAWRTAPFVAGTLYMVNPFTYDRLMAGQYNVLFGYAILPFFLRALLSFLDGPAAVSAAVLAGWLTLIGIVSIHTLGLAAVLAIAATGVMIWRRREPGFARQLSVWGAAALLLFVAASSYWLIPLVLGKGSAAASIAGFGSGDRQAFATAGGSALGRVGNVLRLQGFWAEGRDMYVLPQDNVPVWGILALMLWGVAALGAWYWWRFGRRREALLLGAAMALAVPAAVGFGQDWAAAHLPLFAGYREPQKFVALLALGYAVFAAGGAAALLDYCQKYGGKAFQAAAGMLLLLLPFAFTPTIVWGCNRQLLPVRYPAGWFTANRLLMNDAGSFRVLFLPWHLYMYFGFAGRIIASPAPDFFDAPVIVSDNPEFRGVALAGATPAKRELDTLLPAAASNSSLGMALARLRIKYVLLAKDDDYQNYGYLLQHHDLQRVWQGPALELYRNNAFGGTP